MNTEKEQNEHSMNTENPITKSILNGLKSQGFVKVGEGINPFTNEPYVEMKAANMTIIRVYTSGRLTKLN